MEWGVLPIALLGGIPHHPAHSSHSNDGPSQLGPSLLSVITVRQYASSG